MFLLCDEPRDRCDEVVRAIGPEATKNMTWADFITRLRADVTPQNIKVKISFLKQPNTYLSFTKTLKGIFIIKQLSEYNPKISRLRKNMDV